MESYIGHVQTQLDAIILFEACRLGLLPRIRRRLTDRERLRIGSGCVFIWDEHEAGLKRWTDGKSWSASRVSGSFLCYREMDFSKKRGAGSSSNNSGDDEELRYKKDGLYKQSFSLTTATGLKLHMISYYKRSDLTLLKQPSKDEAFSSIQIPMDLYPDNTTNGTTVPAVTRVPMAPSDTMPLLAPAIAPAPPRLLLPATPASLPIMAPPPAISSSLRAQPVSPHLNSSLPIPRLPSPPAWLNQGQPKKPDLPNDMLSEDRRALGMLDRVFII
jgi:hypothetical protein